MSDHDTKIAWLRCGWAMCPSAECWLRKNCNRNPASDTEPTRYQVWLGIPDPEPGQPCFAFMEKPDGK